MNRFKLPTAFCALFLTAAVQAAPAFAQSPSRPSPQAPRRPSAPEFPRPDQQAPAKDKAPAKGDGRDDAQDVFRINTQLVQIDAVVTGKGGAHVDDLKESDFELFVDGKKRAITHFQMVDLNSPAAAAGNAGKPRGPSPAPPAIKRIEPGRIGRTVAFVVDDLGLSIGSLNAARDALKKFVSAQMQDGDLVGIIQTGKGLGALQQFTSDRRVLNAAIAKLKWNPFSRDMMPQFGAKTTDALQGAGESDATLADRQAMLDGQLGRTEDFRETVFTVGTLGAVNFVVRGLRELPGRKMIVLISDGFLLFGRNHDNAQTAENLRRLTDLANRSSVVIYTVDARGLLDVAPTAADDVLAKDLQRNLNNGRAQDELNAASQEGLIALARGTGGFAAINNNDINLGIQRALQDNQSYYLLGFDPDDDQFGAKYRDKFHAIKIKVNRPGLEVRTRSGYFGVPNNLARETPKTREQQIMNALFSPFGAKDLSIQMTSTFFSPQQGKFLVRSFLRVGPEDLSFTDLPTGEKGLSLDVATFTFDENGKAVENGAKWYELRFNKAQYESTLKNGLAYEHDTPIQKPGAYQFRVVIRDKKNEKLGSAGQFITVPDLSKNRLALSGITLSGDRASDAAEGASDALSRRFAPDARLEYWLIIYNAQLEKELQKPRATIQSEIYKDGQDGKPIYKSAAREVPVIAGQTDLKRLVCGGQIQLTKLPPGDYLLHVTVRDPLAGAKNAEADQWTDFSVQ